MKFSVIIISYHRTAVSWCSRGATERGLIPHILFDLIVLRSFWWPTYFDRIDSEKNYWLPRLFRRTLFAKILTLHLFYWSWPSMYFGMIDLKKKYWSPDFQAAPQSLWTKGWRCLTAINPGFFSLQDVVTLSYEFRRVCNHVGTQYYALFVCNWTHPLPI